MIEYQMEKHQLPGVALAVIENGEIAYLKGYGTAGNGRAMTAQTQMFLGSQSKSFTALAIAQLAECGKIDLNAPVQQYIPWFQVSDEQASKIITINHLLHHTSGLSDSGLKGILPNDASLEGAVQSLAKAELTAPVGMKHQYFNLGYSVLSYIVEQTSRLSYADYLEANIFTPLGMDSSTAEPETATNLSQGYSRLFGFAIPMKQAVPAYAVGQGYIVSTAEDMAKYALAIIKNEGDLVSVEMMNQIMTPGIGSYGMGWIIVDYGAKIFHGGANETFRTDVNLYPRQNKGFVLLTNEGHQLDHFISTSQLKSAVESALLNSNVDFVKKSWSVRYYGWILGFIVLLLLVLHTTNFLALRKWAERIKTFSSTRRFVDVAISFIIPSCILLAVFFGVKDFYGHRFNLLINLFSLPTVLPDIFILMLVGIIPDYIQGMIKVLIWNKNFNKPK
ncbi:MAG: hypothetical protein CVU93_01855 [Firmicutes bacterium HGW-Firmicutes-18]|nr:MAG: hypothetical protein CVU93_01855 [Firmicutes bacterium HGW-Firmicutes-18]